MFGTVLYFAVLAGLAAQPFQSVPGIVPDTFVADATQVRDVETSPFGSYVAICNPLFGESSRADGNRAAEASGPASLFTTGWVED